VRGLCVSNISGGAIEHRRILEQRHEQDMVGVIVTEEHVVDVWGPQTAILQSIEQQTSIDAGVHDDGEPLRPHQRHGAARDPAISLPPCIALDEDIDPVHGRILPAGSKRVPPETDEYVPLEERGSFAMAIRYVAAVLAGKLALPLGFT
jgi:hypothetical protein